MNYYRIFSKIFEITAKKKCLECQDFIKQGSKILDLGCGSGIIGQVFKNYFKAEVIGVDIKDQRVVSLPFKIIDGKLLPFKDNFFDTVLISYVLHHSNDPICLLKEAKRVVKDKILIYEDLPNGIISNLICKIHGISYNHLIQKNDENGKFLNNEQWKEIFNKLRLKLIFEKKVSSNLNPKEKRLFILEKA